MSIVLDGTNGITVPQGATQAQAEAGTSNIVLMTPLRTEQYLVAAVGFSNRYVGPDTTIALNGIYTFTHGLGALPSLVQIYLVCVTAERGWAIGDVIPITSGTENYNANVAPAIGMSTTYIKVRIADGQLIRTIGLDGSTRGTLTEANWKLRVVAWA